MAGGRITTVAEDVVADGTLSGGGGVAAHQKGVATGGSTARARFEGWSQQ